LAASASNATTPIVIGSGGTPVRKAQVARPSTSSPKAAMHAALTMAALARTCSAAPTTASESA
jgi:hypothetical protein